MRKIFETMKFVASCVLAPAVVILLVLSYVIAICNSWIREAVFMLSTDVGKMLDDAIYWVEDKTLDITGAFYR